MNKIGSSETIRKTTFNFNNYNQNLVSHKKKINIHFLEWFIGFAEGDGSFIVSSSRSFTGVSSCRLFFIINQKEEKILYFIKENLGFGKVSNYKTYSRFIVADKTNIDRLISIFNGNLVLKKTNIRFALWVQARNTYCKEKIQYLESLFLEVIKSQIEFFDNNAWLSGFIDAEGCFNVVRLQDSRYSLGYRVRLRFILDQKNEIEIFKKLQTFLQSGVLTKRKTKLKVSEENLDFVAKNQETMFRFTCTSVLSHEKLLNYLKKYPLHTIKKVSFLRFTSLLRYIKNKKKVPWQNKVLRKVEKLIKNI